MAKPDAAAAEGNAGGADGSGGAADGEAVLRAVLSHVDAEGVNCDEDEAALLERLGQLDLLLTWLWRVHGIDYYAGKELLLAADYADRTRKLRTIRGPRPEEGEEQDEDEGEYDCLCLLQMQATSIAQSNTTFMHLQLVDMQVARCLVICGIACDRVVYILVISNAGNSLFMLQLWSLLI